MDQLQSVASVSQRLIAPKTWLGSEAINLLHIISELLSLVEQMNKSLASHVHGNTPLPSNSHEFLIVH